MDFYRLFAFLHNFVMAAEPEWSIFPTNYYQEPLKHHSLGSSFCWKTDQDIYGINLRLAVRFNLWDCCRLIIYNNAKLLFGCLLIRIYLPCHAKLRDLLQVYLWTGRTGHLRSHSWNLALHSHCFHDSRTVYSCNNWHSRSAFNRQEQIGPLWCQWFDLLCDVQRNSPKK